MNFYYSLKEGEERPNLLGNFNSFHHAEAEVRKLLNDSFGQFTDGYLFLHKSAIPWRSLQTTSLGRFRLVRIVSIRPPRKIGTVNFIATNSFEDVTAVNQTKDRLPKAS